MSNQLDIRIVPGKDSPHYEDAEGLQIEQVVITEQGTQSNLPIVDFVCRDAKGATFVFTTTGRLVLLVAASLRGINLRNHGVLEP